MYVDILTGQTLGKKYIESNMSFCHKCHKLLCHGWHFSFCLLNTCVIYVSFITWSFWNRHQSFYCFFINLDLQDILIFMGMKQKARLSYKRSFLRCVFYSEMMWLFKDGTKVSRANQLYNFFMLLEPSSFKATK